ncbi:MAG: CHAT domain-containing protein, partial [bacterium]|nr:CHAT domain-containing protein [bacterium]
LGDRHSDVSKTFNYLAHVYGNKGDYEKSRYYTNKSIAIKLQQFQGVRFNIQQKYKLLEEKEVGKEGFAEARRYFKNHMVGYMESYGKSNPYIAVINENLGILYVYEGKYGQAQEALLKSLRLRLDIYGDGSAEVAANYLNLGICMRLRGNYEEAMQYFKQALQIKKDDMGMIDTDVADIYYHMGKIYFKTRNYSKALSYYQKALAAIAPEFSGTSIYRTPSNQQVITKDHLLKILAAKAETLRLRYLHVPARIKELHLALKTYLQAADLVDEIRRGYKSESYKLFFGEKSHGIYDEGIRTAMYLFDETGDNQFLETAFMLSERSKAALLAEILNESRALRFAGIPAELLEEERKLKRELNIYDTLMEKKLRNKRHLNEKHPDAGEFRVFETKFYHFKRKYRQLIEHFEKYYGNYYNLKYNPSTVTVKNIRESLSEDSACIEYFVGEMNLFIFVLTREKLEVFSMQLDRNFHRVVDSFCSSIKKIEVNSFLIHGKKLYGYLIKPVAHLLAGKKKLIMIPHGKLFYVPFEALPRNQKSFNTGNLTALEYMIKRYTFRYHYSARLWYDSLQVAARTPPVEKSLAGFAPVFADAPTPANTPTPTNTKDSTKQPVGNTANIGSNSRDVVVEGIRFPHLPGTEKELWSIINLFREKGKRAIGFFKDEATEARFKSPEMRDFSIIHVATHSLKQAENPKLSGLLFSRDASLPQVEDGVLYSGETYNLRQRAELIVLSSCESGVGQLVKGEGMVAVNRGFLYSGIRNTIFSLWKVEDKTTSRLMVSFYRKVLDGKTYAAALRDAKLNLIGDRLTAFPRYWSGFILVGE